ncbi:hypothetical protein LDE02_12880 [Lactobacillus delbrueckii subsp. lactis]|nr:hypothetical protein LDE02_12880 [Lactobacillus delbrueckii subsp. lactis]
MVTLVAANFHVWTVAVKTSLADLALHAAVGERSDNEIADLDIINLVTDCFYDPDGFVANCAFRPVRNASEPPQV